MSKKVIIVCMVMLLLCSCSNTGSINNLENGIAPVKIAIFPTGMDSETYLVEITDSGNMKVFFGTKKSDDIQSADFLDTSEQKEKMLTENEKVSLYKLEKEVNKTRVFISDASFFDAWEVIIYINNKTYDFYYGTNESKDCYDNMIDEIVKCSPLAINMRGFA